MADRYCRNCGHELRTSDRFCRGCGRPVHEAARVATPEAEVPGLRSSSTQPPPNQESRRPSTLQQWSWRDPYLLVLIGTLLFATFVGFVSGLLRGRAKGEDVAYTTGLALGEAVGQLIVGLFLTSLVLGLGGTLIYVSERRRSAGDGLTFLQAISDWKVTVVAAAFVFLSAFL